MKRLLPYPLFAFVLLLVWLVLNGSAEPAHLLLGAFAGIGGAAAYALLVPPTGKARRRLAPAARLLGAVLADIVRSNIAVLRIVLGLRRGPRVAGFLPIPLELRDPSGLAVLACIVTATPGTSWARYDAAAGVLTLHVLDLADPQGTVREFKDRYERRLLEIFG